MKISLPFRTVSAANAREHWAIKSRRNKEERTVTKLAVRNSIQKLLRITLTRHGPRKLDSDNLAGSFKAVRDGVADALGIDDGSDAVEWVYHQEPSKEYGVTIEISAKE